MNSPPEIRRDINFIEIIKNQPVLIDKKKLLDLIPLSARTIFDLEKEGKFPRRFFITSRRVAWDLNEINEWIQEKKNKT